MIDRERRAANGDPQPFFRASRNRWEVHLTLPPGDDGRRRRKVITGRTRQDVTRKKRETLTRLDQLGDLPTKEATLSDFAAVWIDREMQGDRRAKTLTEYRSVMNRHILPRLGSRRLAQLQPGDVSRMLADVARTPRAFGSDEPVSVHVVKSARKVLSACLSAAEHDGLVSRNVAQLARMPSARRNAPRDALTLVEVRSVLEHAADAADPLTSLWWAAMLTGARRGELLGLRRSDVTADSITFNKQLQALPYVHGCAGKCHERHARSCPSRRLVTSGYEDVEQLHGVLALTDTKTDFGRRTMPLVEPLRTVLLAHIDATDSTHGLVWERPGGLPYVPEDVTATWKRLRIDAGITKDVKMHGLRNTGASLYYAAGVPEQTIKQLLGHATVEQTREYSRADLGIQAKHLEPLTRLVTEAMEGTA